MFWIGKRFEFGPLSASGIRVDRLITLQALLIQSILMIFSQVCTYSQVFFVSYEIGSARLALYLHSLSTTA
jgi:hypothetical protein